MRDEASQATTGGMTTLGHVEAWRVLVSDVQSARREAVERAHQSVV